MKIFLSFAGPPGRGFPKELFMTRWRHTETMKTRERPASVLLIEGETRRGRYLRPQGFLKEQASPIPP